MCGRPHWGAWRKKMKVILKILKYVFIILFSLILILYVSLNIYVKSKEVKVDKNELLRSSTISLSEEQIKIASIVLNGNSNPEFHNYIFLINDAFSKRNYVALATAFSYLGEHDNDNFRKSTSNERRIIELATKRFIMKKIDYVTCYNYIFSKYYFGNNMYGLSDASNFYFSKQYTELTDKEFISLCLLFHNPTYYDFRNENNRKRCEKELNRIYLLYRKE